MDAVTGIEELLAATRRELDDLLLSGLPVGRKGAPKREQALRLSLRIEGIEAALAAARDVASKVGCPITECRDAHGTSDNREGRPC